MSFRLTRKAEGDIISIYLTGIGEFGTAQADSYHASLEKMFQLIGDNPRIAREREEITPAIRAHPHKSHLIIYRIEDDGVLIIRVRHAREDWISNPAG